MQRSYDTGRFLRDGIAILIVFFIILIVVGMVGSTDEIFIFAGAGFTIWVGLIVIGYLLVFSLIVYSRIKSFLGWTIGTSLARRQRSRQEPKPVSIQSTDWAPPIPQKDMRPVEKISGIQMVPSKTWDPSQLRRSVV